MSDARETTVQKYERQVQTPAGVVGYLDTGGDLPVALFVHGVATGSTLWSNAIPLLADQRRCIAVDLPLHGRTPAARDQEFTLTAMAQFLTEFCDALGLTEFDLVGNDTGGAICQVFAVREAKRLRSFTLTNCDTQGNFPPKAFVPTVLMARARLLDGCFAADGRGQVGILGSQHPVGLDLHGDHRGDSADDSEQHRCGERRDGRFAPAPEPRALGCPDSPRGDRPAVEP